jgi:hypothetical protein
LELERNNRFVYLIAMEELRKKYWYILLWIPLFLLSGYSVLTGAFASYESLYSPPDVYSDVSDVSCRVLLFNQPGLALTPLDFAFGIIACSLIWFGLLFVHPKFKRN